MQGRTLHRLADRGLESSVCVGDDEVHRTQPAVLQAREERRPQHLALGVAHAHAEDLTDPRHRRLQHARLMHERLDEVVDLASRRARVEGGRDCRSQRPADPAAWLEQLTEAAALAQFGTPTSMSPAGADSSLGR